MNMLVIGGTRFVGRHLVEAALARGDSVTVFHRGETGADLFPEAEHVLGNRHEGGLHELRGRRFDVIVDTTAYHPDAVTAVAEIGAAERYVLVSSASVYRDPIAPGSDEDSPVWELTAPIPRVFSTPIEYGGLKVLCEREATERFGGALVIRPGLIIGPHDWSGRLGSWLRRVRDRRFVLAGEPSQPLQLIDARDLAEWLLRLCVDTVSGVYNAVGQPTTMAELLTLAAAMTMSPPDVRWAGDEFLSSRRVELPLWIPSDEAGLFQLSNARASGEGLRLRPLEQSIRDVAIWEAEDPATAANAGPLDDDAEDALLAELAST